MGGLVFSAPRKLVQDDFLDGFCCGAPTVDMWLKTHAKKAESHGTAVVYVSFCKENLAGFYTLSSQSISRQEVAGGWLTRNTPPQIPVILIGMLGVDQKYKSQGLGSNLLLDAVKRSKSVCAQIGVRALVVDPLDETARKFYSHFGFKEIPGTNRMYAKLVQ